MRSLFKPDSNLARRLAALAFALVVAMFSITNVAAQQQSRAAEIYWQLMNNNNSQFRYGAVAIPIQVAPRSAQHRQGVEWTTQTNEQITQQTAPNYTATAGPSVEQQNSGRHNGSRGPLWGVISELRGGILSHDVIFPDRHDLRWPNPFRNDRESGVDVNGEVMFVSPAFLDILFAPRPHAGLMINSAGDTSSAYAGLTWDGKWESGVFLEGFLGMAVHDGKRRNGNPDRIEFGSRALFRLGGEVGWRYDDTHGISVIWDHMSNAGLISSKNQGIDNIGIRYGYNFSH